MKMDDDQLELQIEMPKSERKKLTTPILNSELKFWSDQPNEFKLFLEANQTYVRNVINKKEDPFSKDEKRKVIAGAIIYKEFQLVMRRPTGVEDDFVEISGTLTLSYVQYKGLTLIIYFKHFQVTLDDYLVARFMITNKDQRRFKTFKLLSEQIGQWQINIEDEETDMILEKGLVIEVEFQRDSQRQEKYVGIRNQGNTCYMNSILQVLFFIRPLRKAVIQYQGQGKVILALKEVFIGLIDGPISRRGAVEAEDLIEAYGRFAQFPRRQQDTQEFLLGFLEELEGECPSLGELWQGQSIQTIESTEQQRPYRSSQKEEFSGLDLPLEDFKGNTFGQMNDSLKYLMESEQVEDKIDTQDYGKVSVIKSRSFLALPPILFLTLKRYEFKKSAIRPTKIMADLNYPHRINLGFLFDTPTGEDMEYQLFAVTVHKGQHYSSGHYYSFVNTSSQMDYPSWAKFDDSRVHLASNGQALGFSGGKKKTICWNGQFQRFMEKQYTVQDTAYVLVYFQRSMFKGFQELSVSIPKNWYEKKRQAQANARQIGTNEDGQMVIELMVLDLEGDGNIFGSIQTIPIGLQPHTDTVSQLKGLSGSLLGCKVGSVWKVNKQNCMIKRLLEFSDTIQSPSRIFDAKRGHRVPNYLLIVPERTDIFGGMSKGGHEGLVRVCYTDTDKSVNSQLKLMNKQLYDDFVVHWQKKLGRHSNVKVEDKEDFEGNWNDYIQMVFE